MRKKPVPQQVQSVAGFIIPTIILLTLSDESKLGPLYAMLISLAFPIAVELYALVTGRKVSYVSLFAIVGILLIGVISLLGLSEEWLAARRAAFYVITGIGLLIATRFKRSMIDTGLGLVIDTTDVYSAAKNRRTEAGLHKTIAKSAYALAALLLAIGVWSYVFTLVFMSAPTGSSEFNAQYAELRIWSLPAVTLPLLIGVVGILMVLFSRLERLTGLEADRLLKKR